MIGPEQVPKAIPMPIIKAPKATITIPRFGWLFEHATSKFTGNALPIMAWDILEAATADRNIFTMVKSMRSICPIITEGRYTLDFSKQSPKSTPINKVTVSCTREGPFPF